MCGRFVLTANKDELGEAFPTFSFPDDLPKRYNIAPTQPVLVLKNTPTPIAEFVYWGLIPSWSKDSKFASKLINARSETVSEKPSFKAAIKRRRCLIPASGYYEWITQGDSKAKQPYYIYPHSKSPLALAGLWEIWHSPEGDEIHSCTILTTQANEFTAPLHHRMPVILEGASQGLWLESDEKDPRIFDNMLVPNETVKMEAHPVSREVNSPSNDRSSCTEPIAPT